MGWQYAAVCLFDFILAPIMLVLFSYKTGQPYIQWHPITLEGAGTYHISMMAILGITSWSRGQEKIKEMTQGN